MGGHVRWRGLVRQGGMGLDGGSQEGAGRRGRGHNNNGEEDKGAQAIIEQIAEAPLVEDTPDDYNDQGAGPCGQVTKVDSNILRLLHVASARSYGVLFGGRFDSG